MNKALEPLPYYKWHWRDYRANRRVQRMSWQAKGIYRELLDEFWAEGSLPLDHLELADICGCALEEFEKYWPQISPCWEELDGRLTNSKMDSMRTAIDSTRVANAKNGQAGAIAKLANAKQSLATAKRTSGVRHIAEQSRAEQSSPRQARSSDPRHYEFKNACELYASHKRVTFVWDGAEAKQLSALLSAAPDLTLEIFQKCLNNRAKSPVAHGDRMREWVGKILRFQEGPLDQYGKPVDPISEVKPTTAAEKLRRAS